MNNKGEDLSSSDKKPETNFIPKSAIFNLASSVVFVISKFSGYYKYETLKVQLYLNVTMDVAPVVDMF